MGQGYINGVPVSDEAFLLAAKSSAKRARRMEIMVGSIAVLSAGAVVYGFIQNEKNKKLETKEQVQAFDNSVFIIMAGVAGLAIASYLFNNKL